MAKPHYVVRRSRSGRFNFALITEGGRLTGSVHVSLDGQAPAEIERMAYEKIRAIAGSFASANGMALMNEVDPPSEGDADEAPTSGEVNT